MNFWDTSALLPLIVAEKQSHRMAGLFTRCADYCLWTLTVIEAQAALNRGLRENRLDRRGFTQALRQWEKITAKAYEVTQIATVKMRAERILALHPLKAADALQLAAALVVTGDYPQGNSFFSLDDRLNQAAAKEGFATVES